LIVSLLSFVSTLLAFSTQVLTATIFGAGPRIDRYLVASSVPFLVLGTLVGAISYSIVPTLADRRTRLVSRFPCFAGDLGVAFILIGLSLLLLGYLISPYQVLFLAPELTGTQFDECVFIARVCWGIAAVSCLTNFLMALHQAAHSFALPVSMSLLPYFGMLALIVTCGRTSGPAVLPLGMLLGTIAGLLPLLIGARHHITIRPSVRRLATDVFPVVIALPAVGLSVLCTTMFGTIDGLWVYHLGPGALSYLGYSVRIIVALGSAIAQGVFVVLPPLLSCMAAADQREDFRHQTERAIRFLFALSCPAAVIVGVLRVPLIELLFQRGAFDAQATLGTAAILPGFLLGMIAMVEVVLLLRILHVYKDVWGCVALGAIGSLLYFSLSAALSYAYGIRGVSIAYCITWWLLLCIVLVLFSRRHACNILSDGAARFAGAIGVSSVMCGMSVSLCLRHFTISCRDDGFVLALLETLVSAAAGSIVFLVTASRVFAVPEITYATRCGLQLLSRILGLDRQFEHGRSDSSNRSALSPCDCPQGSGARSSK